MRLMIGRIDDHRLQHSGFASETVHHPAEDSLVTSPFPTVVERLRRATLLERIMTPQAIAIDEDYAAQNPPDFQAGPAAALGENGLRCAILASVSKKRLLISHCPCEAGIAPHTQDQWALMLVKMAQAEARRELEICVDNAPEVHSQTKTDNDQPKGLSS